MPVGLSASLRLRQRRARDGTGHRRHRDAALPARYMGHASIESSYYYIHTSPDFMHAYAHITAQSQSLLPEVGFE